MKMLVIYSLHIGYQGVFGTCVTVGLVWHNDKGLIPTKDDGPWHMLRRKGVPWSLPLLLFSLV